MVLHKLWLLFSSEGFFRFSKKDAHFFCSKYLVTIFFFRKECRKSRNCLILWLKSWASLYCIKSIFVSTYCFYLSSTWRCTHGRIYILNMYNISRICLQFLTDKIEIYTQTILEYCLSILFRIRKLYPCVLFVFNNFDNLIWLINRILSKFLKKAIYKKLIYTFK